MQRVVDVLTAWTREPQCITSKSIASPPHTWWVDAAYDQAPQIFSVSPVRMSRALRGHYPAISFGGKAVENGLPERPVRHVKLKK